jgi:hypothetical protein
MQYSKIWAKQQAFFPENKVFWICTKHYEVPLSIFSSIVVAASCYGYACNR